MGSGFLVGAPWILSTWADLPAADLSFGGPLAAALASAALRAAGA